MFQPSVWWCRIWHMFPQDGITSNPLGAYSTRHARWCPSSLAKLVNNSNFTMVYGRYIYTIPMVINQQTSLGGHHIVESMKPI